MYPAISDGPRFSITIHGESDVAGYILVKITMLLEIL